MKTETGLRAQEVKPEDPFAVLSRELHRPNCKSMGKHSCEAVISIDAATIKTFVHKSYLPQRQIAELGEPTQYQIDEDITVQRRAKGWHYAEGQGKVVDGKELWSVSGLSTVLNKDGEWEYEPLPSCRDEVFLQRTRWNSAEEAARFYLSRLYRKDL